jgi:hypothetical protein
LHGMGGIGKTVLAQALCHDEVVQQAFPDGIIWVCRWLREREASRLSLPARSINVRLHRLVGLGMPAAARFWPALVAGLFLSQL